MTPQLQDPGLLWPAYYTPDDLAAIQAVPSAIAASRPPRTTPCGGPA